MLDTAKQGSSQNNILTEISERLTAFTPDKFIVPPMSPKKDAQKAGTASDYIKQLFSLYLTLEVEYQEKSLKIDTSFSEEVHEKLKDLKGDALSELMSKASSGDLSGLFPKTEILHSEINASRKFLKLIKDIFWMEVRREFPEVANKAHIFITSDWAISWEDCPECDAELSMGGLGVEVIDLGGSGMPFDLAELFGDGRRGMPFGHADIFGGRSRGMGIGFLMDLLSEGRRPPRRSRS